jgi:hypothetical protein
MESAGLCVAETDSEAETFTAPTAAEAVLSTFPASISACVTV